MLHIFIMSLLLTTLAAVGMEPADYPQLQLELLQQKPQKPTITADLYISTKDITRYTGSSYKQKLENAGITLKSSTAQKMPFVPIFMMIDKKDGNDGRCWSDTVPEAIWKYEEEQINATGREVTKNDFFAIKKKTIPDSWPASLLYAHDTNSVIHLIVHGHPVVVTCRKNPYSTKSSFGEELNEQINRFKVKPSFFSSLSHFAKESQELVAAKILTEDLKHHGENGFVSMEDLLLEDTRKLYVSTHNYLAQRQTTGRPRLIAKPKAQSEVLQNTSRGGEYGHHGSECILL